MVIKAAAYFLIITLVACRSSSKTNSSVRKQERKDIESLLLVRSLPVSVSGKDSLFRIDIQLLITDSLRLRKYECLDRQTSLVLVKRGFEKLFGANDPQKAREIAEKVSKDKDYFNRENEIADPYLQYVVLFPCTDGSNNCIGVKRQNLPNARKQRTWEIKYGDTEPVNHLVSRIIDSLTTHQSIK